jgi:hypothetical protein
MVKNWRIFFFVFLLVALWSSTALAIVVQAVADRDRVAAGESLQLELRVTGHPDADPDLSPLQQDWDILDRSQSSQIQIINSHISRSVVYSLTLMPKKTGTVTIPAVCFGSDCTIPLPVEVAASSSSGKDSHPPLLLEAEISPQRVVVQEQLLLKVRLLRRIDLINGQLTEPQPDGVVTVIKQLGDAHSYETRRNGQIYKVIERDYAIFPQGSGTLKIPPLRFAGAVANGTSRFDPFSRQGQRVQRVTQPLQVEVLPLPENLGSRSWIPATGLKLQDDWQQQIPKFVVGEPVTRTLRLSADGVLSAQLPLLRLNLPDGFKSYPDQPHREDQVSHNGITGILEQKIALVPTRPGRYQLPAIDLDWWDVTSGEWQHAHLPPLSIDVAAATGTAVTPPVATTPTPPAVEQKSPLPTPAPVSAAVVEKPVQRADYFWPVLSLVLAAGWLVSVLLLSRRRRHFPAIPAPEGMVKPDEKGARNLVIQAARDNDPGATRQALRHWCRLLYPELSTGGYEKLLKSVSPSFRGQLESLDQSLYGNGESGWSGAVLAKLVQDWQPDQTGDNREKLPDLYP